MRLTKTVKEQIINSWVEKKWIKKLNSARDNMLADAKELAEKRLSNEIEIYNSNQHIKQYLCSYDYVGAHRLKDGALPCKYINKIMQTLSVSRYVNEEAYTSSYISHEDSVVLVKKYNDTIQKFNDDMANISNVLASVNTIKRLVELLPDIEKYVPSQSRCTSLVDASCLAKAKAVL